MPKSDDRLTLGENRRIDVTIQHPSRPFCAELKVSASKIRLRISADLLGGTCWPYNERNISQLLAQSSKSNFHLYGLSTVYRRWKALKHGDVPLTHHVTEYEVECLVQTRVGITELKYRAIHLSGPQILSWVGHTETQKKILDAHELGEGVSGSDDLLTEFLHQTPTNGAIELWYNARIHWNPADQSSGIKYPPRITYWLPESREGETVLSEYKKLQSLLAFLCGQEVYPEEIGIGAEGVNQTDDALLYLPINLKKRSKVFEQDAPILFPLSKDLRFPQGTVEPLNLELFSNYYELNSQELEFFQKYQRYCAMASSEERYLGFFRLLEKLTFKSKNYVDSEKLSRLTSRMAPFLFRYFGNKKSVQSFLSGLPRYNQSKYNTEKCMVDFLKSLPKDCTSAWRYEAKDVGGLCRLRNDISHANHFRMTDLELESKSEFVHMLLIVALANKLGLENDFLCRSMPRFSGFSLVKK